MHLEELNDDENTLNWDDRIHKSHESIFVS